METKEIVGLMRSEQSWEQIIYRIVAFEGLDPWDVDIKAMSDAFVDYVTKLEELDFKVPAKYVMVAAVLLRMKSDNLTLLKYFAEDNYVGFGQEAPESGEADVIDNTGNGILNFEVNPISVPQKRMPARKIMVDELVLALRKVLNAEDRREQKRIRAVDMIKLKEDNITKRIGRLYDKINSMLTRVRKDEVKFSSLVDKWEKQEVVNTFLPLVYLENERRVETRQEEMFDEIFVKRREQVNNHPGTKRNKVV